MNSCQNWPEMKHQFSKEVNLSLNLVLHVPSRGKWLLHYDTMKTNPAVFS